MEGAFQNKDEELLNYMDGKLNDAQAKLLKESLASSPALQTRLEQLRIIHTAFSGNALAHPSSNFTHKVMSNLHRLAPSSSISPKNGLLLLCGVLVAIGILLPLLSAGFFDGMNQPISFENLPVSNEVIKEKLPSFSIHGKWIINSLILLTLGLAFILLDRTILRPYFNRRSGLQF